MEINRLGRGRDLGAIICCNCIFFVIGCSIVNLGKTGAGIGATFIILSICSCFGLFAANNDGNRVYIHHEAPVVQQVVAPVTQTNTQVVNVNNPDITNLVAAQLMQQQQILIMLQERNAGRANEGGIPVAAAVHYV